MQHWQQLCLYDSASLRSVGKHDSASLRSPHRDWGSWAVGAPRSYGAQGTVGDESDASWFRRGWKWSMYLHRGRLSTGPLLVLARPGPPGPPWPALAPPGPPWPRPWPRPWPLCFIAVPFMPLTPSLTCWCPHSCTWPGCCTHTSGGSVRQVFLPSLPQHRLTLTLTPTIPPLYPHTLP